jgi:outer membrane lipoprotein-sorting protein
MMENSKDFHHDDSPRLRRAVDAVLLDPIPDDLPPDRVAQLLAVVRHAAERPYPITIFGRIKNMRPRTRIAVAASIVITVFGLASWLVPGGGTALAFGDIVEALNNVHSATWRSTTVVKYKEPQGKTVTWSEVGMFLTPSHERVETICDGQETSRAIRIVDGQKDGMIVLSPTMKTAIVMNIKNVPEENPFGRTFQGLREMVADAQSGKGGNVERLGVETIDGRPAEGFRFQLATIEVKIWADPNTLLPIRVENITTHTDNPEVRIVMTDFQINADSDESLFSLDLPAGYTVQQTLQMDFPKTPLSPLADVLKIAAEYNDGVFPPELRGQQDLIDIMQRVLKTVQEKNAKDATEAMKQVMEITMKWGGAGGFLAAIPPDSWHYAGKDVKLGTPNKPIFWCQRKRDGRGLVLYADLSVKEVSAEELPKMPEPEGSPKP